MNDAIYFRSPAELRRWFAKNHATAKELWLGYHKRHTGRSSVTWPETVDEALCVGWIDGIRKSVDGERYVIRFTPRRAGSVWSAINVARVKALTAAGRMTPAGLAAFALLKKHKVYSYEQRRDHLDEPYLSMIRSNPAAWAFLRAQPPGYRKLVYHWIGSGKREETKQKRVRRLIAASISGRRVTDWNKPDTVKPSMKGRK